MVRRSVCLLPDFLGSKSMTHRTFRIILLSATLLVTSYVRGADEPTAHKAQPLPVDAALSVKSFSQYSPVSFSGDGEWLAYAVRDNIRSLDISPEKYESTGIPHYASGADVYLLNLRTRALRNLTAGGDNWLPTWSPDGRLLAFLSDRDGSGQARLWLWDRRENQMRLASERNIRGAEIEWLPDSSGVVVATAPATTGRQVSKSIPDSLENPSTHDPSRSAVTLYRAGPTAGTEQGNQSAGPWNLDRYRAELVLIDIGHRESKIIAGGGRVATFFLSPDGREVAYTVPKRFELPGSQQILFDLRVVDWHNGQLRTLVADIRLNGSGADFRWSPNGSWISYSTAGMEEKRSDCYAIELASGKQYKLTDFSASATSRWGSLPLWGDSGSIYFLRDGQLWQSRIGERQGTVLARNDSLVIEQMISEKPNVLWIPKRGGDFTIVLAHDVAKEQDGFYRVDLRTGVILPLQENGCCYTCVVKHSSVWVPPDGLTFAFLKEDADVPADLWIGYTNSSASERLTALNPSLENYALGKTRLVEWIGDDGQKLQGTLLLPAAYKEGTLYPLVVWVYGGDLGVDHLHIFGVDSSGPLNMQLLATRGYAVLMPGAPEMAGSLMFDTAKTVLPGVTKVVEMGIADPNRIAVMGHSHGGYSTLSLIVQTRRFAAAVEIDGISDLIGSYGEMDAAGSAYGTAIAEHGGDQMGGTPWQFRDRYIENSPFFFLDRVSTPLLIVQGAADRFVQPFLGDQIFVALRRLDREVEYAKYSGEGHDPNDWSYADQVDLANRIIEWLDRHLVSKPPYR
jgi:dipeptidyl aminopeptidase/acylaminoacyl peptidase